MEALIAINSCYLGLEEWGKFIDSAFLICEGLATLDWLVEGEEKETGRMVWNKAAHK